MLSRGWEALGLEAGQLEWKWKNWKWVIQGLWRQAGEFLTYTCVLKYTHTHFVQAATLNTSPATVVVGLQHSSVGLSYKRIRGPRSTRALTGQGVILAPPVDPDWGRLSRMRRDDWGRW